MRESKKQKEKLPVQKGIPKWETPTTGAKLGGKLDVEKEKTFSDQAKTK